MKMYIVVCCYAYHEFIVGIYSTEDKAKEAIQYDKQHRKADWYNIDEYTVDKIREYY